MGALLRCAAGAATTIGAIRSSHLQTPAFADSAFNVSAADTAWMIVATAFVLMMTIPGLALFYSRHGAQEERAGDDGAKPRGGCGDFDSVGGVRLFAGVHRRRALAGIARSHGFSPA